MRYFKTYNESLEDIESHMDSEYFDRNMYISKKDLELLREIQEFFVDFDDIKFKQGFLKIKDLKDYINDIRNVPTFSSIPTIRMDEIIDDMMKKYNKWIEKFENWEITNGDLENDQYKHELNKPYFKFFVRNEYDDEILIYEDNEGDFKVVYDPEERLEKDKKRYKELQDIISKLDDYKKEAEEIKKLWIWAVK